MEQVCRLYWSVKEMQGESLPEREKEEIEGMFRTDSYTGMKHTLSIDDL